MIAAFHHKRGVIRKRIPFVKTIASALTIGSGGSAGREGPIAQVGAGFGSALATWLKMSDRERRLLMLAGAGDELQGMKRGIIEMLDGMVINKADGDNKPKAERARIEYSGALHLFPASPDGWTPRVETCSSIGGEGIAAVWRMVLEHRELLEANGWLARVRNRQALEWMSELTMLGLEEMFRRNRAVAERQPALREEVRHGRMTPFAASRELLGLFHRQPGHDSSKKKTL